jgi:hypothetical protein
MLNANFVQPTPKKPPPHPTPPRHTPFEGVKSLSFYHQERGTETAQEI